MKKYKVKVKYAAISEYEIEAENEEDAVQKGYKLEDKESNIIFVFDAWRD